MECQGLAICIHEGISVTVTYGKPFHHESFLVPVDKIEAVTGLDFLTILDDEVERQLERQKADSLWKE